MAKAAFNKKTTLSINKSELNSRKTLVKWSTALNGTEIWTLWEVDGLITWELKYYIQSWRTGTSYINYIQRKNANWIGHILPMNDLLKHVSEGNTEGRTEVMERWGRRCKQLLDDLTEKTGYWKLKEASDHTLWKTPFSRGYGPVRRQLQNEWLNEYFYRISHLMQASTLKTLLLHCTATYTVLSQ